MGFLESNVVHLTVKKRAKTEILREYSALIGVIFQWTNNQSDLSFDSF